MASKLLLSTLTRVKHQRKTCLRYLATTNSSRQTRKEAEIDTSNERSVEDMEKLASSSRKLANLDEFRKEMKPFLKELFAGKFDKIVLSYPDVLSNDRYYNCERKLGEISEALLNRSDLIEAIQKDDRISKDLIMSMRSLGFFGHRGTFLHQGEGYSVTESLRFLEEVASKSISLSNVIVNSAWYATEVIRKYGTEEIKAKYLPALHNGTSIAALCIADESAGFDANSVKALMHADVHSQELTLTCEKTWVTNASNADLFIVCTKEIGKFAEDGGNLSPRLTLVLIDAKENNGITVEKPYDTRGLKGCAISTVKFDRVTIPIGNRLVVPGQGFNALTDSLKDEAKLAGCIQILSGLKNAFNATLKRASQRRAFGAPIGSFDQVRDKLGNCALQIFALESAIYMTAGLADYQLNPDICLEATACRLLAAEASKYVTDACKAILGGSTYLKDNEVSKIFDDIEGLNWWESSEDLNKLYLGLGGLAYTAENRQEFTKARRNIFNDFFSAVTHSNKFNREHPTNIFTRKRKLKFQLQENLHPSLAPFADQLETMVLDFDVAVAYLLYQHGADVQLAEVDVAKLATTAARIYAMTSVLARASKSYCDGHPHANLDVQISSTYVNHLEPYVNGDMFDVQQNTFCKITPFIAGLSDFLLDQGFYSVSHPVNKTLF